MRRIIFGLAIFAVTLIAGRVVMAQGGERPPTSVRVAAIEEQVLQERAHVTGSVRAVARTKVAANEEGLAMRVHVQEGDHVERGAVLVELDQRRLEIELRRVGAEDRLAAALVAVRTAELEQSQHDLRSLEGLASGRAARPKELADARSEVNINTARMEEARMAIEVVAARRALLELRIADTTIVAPHGGVVVGRTVEPGQWVGIGDEVIEIINEEAFEIWLEVPQRYTVSMRSKEARIRVDVKAASVSAEGLIPTIVPIIDGVARSFPAYVRLEGAVGPLASGMSATGWIPAGRVGTFLTMPRDALLRNDAGYYVYAGRQTGPDGPAKAMPVQIRVLFEIADRIVIDAAGGLTPSDVVVIEGNERLHPMSPIQWDPDAVVRSNVIVERKAG